MRRLVIALGLVLLASTAQAEVLNLKTTWTANVDTVTTGYKLYRGDGTRTLIGTIPGKTTAQYLFTVTVPDNSTGTLT
jgi:hypothetical protein